jgi:hypothetical protein
MKLHLKAALLLFVCLLLISKLSICQHGYPKLIVYSGDTLVALTVEQATIINLMELQAVKYRDLSDTLVHHSNKKDVVLFDLNTVLKVMHKERELQGQLTAECERTMKQIEKELNKQIKKTNRAAFWGKVAVAVVVAETVMLILITQ